MSPTSFQTAPSRVNVIIIDLFLLTVKFYAKILVFIPVLIKVSKNGSQLSGWQVVQNRDCFCDFGRKLVNLSLAVHVQCFAAMDGSKSLSTPWTGCLRRTRHSIITRLSQTQIFLFSYNGTKQTRLCANYQSQNLKPSFAPQSYRAKRYRCKATPYFTSASIVSRLQGVCTDVFYLLLHIL